MPGVAVLMYHALEDPQHPAGTVDPGVRRYVLQVSEFREQMHYLKRAGYRTLLLDELLSEPVRPEKAVVISFDDGHESNCLLALPILLEYGFRAEFFITTGWTGTPGFLSAAQIRELERAGMGIGSHGVTHAFLSDLDPEPLQAELLESRLALERICSRPIRNISLPGGRGDAACAAIALRHGYRAVCTSQPWLFFGNSRAQLIPRFAIRQGDFQFFTKVVTQHAPTLLNVALRYQLLHLLKLLVGNKRYEALRGILLGPPVDSA